MIRQDKISKFLIVLAMMLTVFLATFETTTLVLFPGFLLIFGLGMELFLERRKSEELTDPLLAHKPMKEIGYYTLIAMIAIFMTGYMVNLAKTYQIAPGFSAISYSFLMAVAEEQFFRGFITDFLLTTYPDQISIGFSSLPGWLMALVTSALIFTMYHLARYSASPDAMLYVFAGGFILSWVAWKSRRLSPCMMAHAINNILVVLGAM